MSHINYNDEELQTFISSCHCWNEVLTKLDMKTMTRSLQRRIKGAGIQCDNLGAHFDGLHTKFNKFTQEKIAEIVQTNTDWTTVMDLLGYRSCIHLVIIQKKLDKLQMIDIVIFGTYISSEKSKFKSPAWGEVIYQYRMSKAGWDYGSKK